MKKDILVLEEDFMVIAGLQKLTTTDFPGQIAAIIVTQGCNLKCPYCQNSGLIPICISENSRNSF